MPIEQATAHLAAYKKRSQDLHPDHRAFGRRSFLPMHNVFVHVNRAYGVFGPASSNSLSLCAVQNARPEKTRFAHSDG